MSRHIQQFETLRGFTALWVFASHVLIISEVSVPFLTRGGAAVDVFIILSGFVITLLRLNSPEPYASYIFRRFARLYPLFLIALLMGLATSHLYATVIGPSFWGGETIPNFLTRKANEDAHFWKHVILHLTMLHGTIPDTILPQASLMFSGPLWSISLEWQFYLVAPAIVWSLDLRQNGRWPWALLALGAIAISNILAERYWIGETPSFLPLRLSLFLLGVFCGFWWSKARQASVLMLTSILITGYFAYAPFAPNPISVLLWLGVFGIAALGERFRLTATINGVLTSRPFRWLGERSYGFYVLHMPIILVLAEMVVLPFAATLGRYGTLAALTMLGLPAALACSAFSYSLIEQPVIRWAKMCVRPVGAPSAISAVAG